MPREMTDEEFMDMIADQEKRAQSRNVQPKPTNVRRGNMKINSPQQARKVKTIVIVGTILLLWALGMTLWTIKYDGGAVANTKTQQIMQFTAVNALFLDDNGDGEIDRVYFDINKDGIIDANMVGDLVTVGSIPLPSQQEEPYPQNPQQP